MSTEKLNDILFYSLEKSIKTYRRFAQRNIDQAKCAITIDQWLVLKALQDCPDVTQQQLAVIVFKDFASVTRIIELLVGKNYINRSFHPQDRRRFNLSLTPAGLAVIGSLQATIDANRHQALKGISPEAVAQLQITLNQIIANCES